MASLDQRWFLADNLIDIPLLIGSSGKAKYSRLVSFT